LHRRDAIPAQRLTGAQPPLAGDQLVARGAFTGRRAHYDRLQQTRFENRGLQLFQRGRIHVPARLVGVGPNLGDRQLDEAPFAFGFFAGGSQQGFEPSTETPATSDGFRHAGTSGSGSGAGGAGGTGGTDAAAPARSTRRISSWATA